MSLLYYFTQLFVNLSCYCIVTDDPGSKQIINMLVQRSLISGNIKTNQDAINLLGKLDALETRDAYRNPKQNFKNHDSSRRPHYNSRGDRTDRNQCDSMGVQHVQYGGGSNYDRQRAYGSSNRHNRRGHYDSGWGELEERRCSRGTRNNSLSLNPSAQNFEPRTENTRSNFQEQRPSCRDSGDVLNN